MWKLNWIISLTLHFIIILIAVRLIGAALRYETLHAHHFHISCLGA